jgi:hypothetical protein
MITFISDNKTDNIHIQTGARGGKIFLKLEKSIYHPDRRGRTAV